jgi:hypothetical protein
VLEIVRPYEASNLSQGVPVPLAMASRLAKFSKWVSRFSCNPHLTLISSIDNTAPFTTTEKNS